MTTIAVVLGDPGGIGPEVVARSLSAGAGGDDTQVLLVGSRDEAELGMQLARARFDYSAIDDPRDVARPSVRVALWDRPVDAGAPFERAGVGMSNGRYCLETLRLAVELTVTGVTGAVCFGPLNKGAMHRAGMGHPDEAQWFAELLGATGAVGELNVLDGLWTSRVTSHVPLKEVSSLITTERILSAIELVHASVVSAGVAHPRIAVCGLNPHNGDNGTFGREEIDVIAPALDRARERGFTIVGLFPADTIFLRAKEVDAIVTMYHDQGQIAMKLMGFSRGVTVHAGLPIPITTPAHGTAFDIYGQGLASAGAMTAAIDLAARLARGRSR